MAWMLSLTPWPEPDRLVPWLVAVDAKLQLPRPEVTMGVTAWGKLTLPSQSQAHGPESSTVPGLSIRSLSTSHL
jgi:hypothetical protein